MTLSPPTAAKSRRRRPVSVPIPAELRKELVRIAREHSEVFNDKPYLKPVAVRYFAALLQPHRPAGRKCEPNITTATRLFRRYRRSYPDEPDSRSWNRIYPVAIPGVDALSPQEASREKRNLRAAVRARPNARRRRRAKAKQ